MADISYTRTTWADGAEGGTPIDAAKLNNIEQGVVDAVAAIGPNDTTEDGTLKAQIDENASDIETLQESVAKTVVDAGLTRIKFSVSANGNRNIDFVLSNGNTETWYYNSTGIGVWNTATSTGYFVRWTS